MQGSAIRTFLAIFIGTCRAMKIAHSLRDLEVEKESMHSLRDSSGLNALANAL
jgi:hypothetical protein